MRAKDMKGEYIGCCNKAQIAVFFVSRISITVCLLADICGVGGIIAILLSVITIIVLVVLGNVECRWTADEQGFAIAMFGRERRFSYGELESVSCEYSNADRYGNAYVVLTVKTRSGLVKSYTESVGEKLHIIMNDPKACQPQLMKLCDCVNSRQGGQS